MTLSLKSASLALAATGLALSAPAAAAAAPAYHGAQVQSAPVYGDTTFNQYRERGRYDRRGYGRDQRRDQRYNDQRQSNYGEPVYRDTQVWQGNDGRYYCKKENGTTGLLIGAGVGALIGHEVAGRNGDRTLGAILGAAGGALLGRTIDRSSSRCN